MEPSTLSALLPWVLAAAAGLLGLIWVYLWLFHYRFWSTRIPSAVAPGKNHDDSHSQPSVLPPVLTVIPARNEAEVIAQTVRNVLLQDYAGAIHLVVVNDNSDDATAQIAQQTADQLLAALTEAETKTETEERTETATDQTARGARRFTLVNGNPLPEGWSGKLWAVEQGIRTGLRANTDSSTSTSSSTDTNTSTSTTAGTSAHEGTETAGASYVWLTDADIAHEPQVLRELVNRATADNRALVSRMAHLCIDTAAERWTIPAFVYFFQLLYPFAAIARPQTGIHGAAGGCILLRTDYLHKIGGIGSLRGALIDDCTLAAHVAKAGGRLWLELTHTSRSLRGYGSASGVSDMIARTAYTQLGYSPVRLAGTVLGLLFVFWAPPLISLISLLRALSWPLCAGSAPTALLWIIALIGSVTASTIMVGTFVPMLRFYGLNPSRALALPGIATFYLCATIKSAIRHYKGKTGNWKGRTYAS